MHLYISYVRTPLTFYEVLSKSANHRYWNDGNSTTKSNFEECYIQKSLKKSHCAMNLWTKNMFVSVVSINTNCTPLQEHK